MAGITVKDLQEALRGLDENKEIVVVHSYSPDERIEVSHVRELKERGIDYYKINLKVPTNGRD